MQDKYPLVSVIIPVYNRKSLVIRAIKSILEQSYQNFEIIVIDDGSREDIKSFLDNAQYRRIKYYRNNTNMGVAFSRNRGVKLSNGSIIVFQDSDDESNKERIKKTVEILISSKDNIAAVYCGRELYDSITGSKIGVNLRETDFKHNFTKGKYFLTPGTGTLTIRKNIFETVGLFDERMRTYEDTEFAIRVSEKFEYIFVKEPLIKVFRNHDQLRANLTEPVKAREIIYNKHKTYLSPTIVYGLCKSIANYYILNKEMDKGKYYIRESFKYKLELKTIFQYVGMLIIPSLIKSIYKFKYKEKFPTITNISLHNIL